MSKRDISAGIRARQRVREAASAVPQEPVHYVPVPLSLDDALERHLFLVNQAARAAGAPGYTKRTLVELALRDFVELNPAEIVSRHPRKE